MTDTRPQPWNADDGPVVRVSARDATTVRVVYDVRREALRALTLRVNRARPTPVVSAPTAGR